MGRLCVHVQHDPQQAKWQIGGPFVIHLGSIYPGGKLGAGGSGTHGGSDTPYIQVFIVSREIEGWKEASTSSATATRFGVGDKCNEYVSCSQQMHRGFG